VRIREVEIDISLQIPQKSMTPETKAPVMTPDPKENTGAIATLAHMRDLDIGATATLAPKTVIDTGAQVTLAKTSDTVIKAPVTDRTATIIKVKITPDKRETPVMTEGQVMTHTTSSQRTAIDELDHQVYMSPRAMVVV